MTSWALLLLASVLMATPGLTFSGQSPEDHDLSMADMSEEEQFFEILAREALKSDPIIFTCKPCKFMIRMLRKSLGEDIDEEAIKQGASMLCRKTFMPKMLCDDIISRYLSAVTQGILNDKSPQEICVKIRMCRGKIGLGASGALADPGEKHRIFSDHRQLLPS
ncbi:granulysin isoform X2 [Ailuropoda melanoleuca]|uniref:granulysin isoform X2 n=1 Tax=Ailuropoda melanoleuca TaxID=9646 RepID=UPI001494000E|nr:granulysin isoform X2 [Ailuropoda melanoleuca]